MPLNQPRRRTGIHSDAGLNLSIAGGKALQRRDRNRYNPFGSIRMSKQIVNVAFVVGRKECNDILHHLNFYPPVYFRSQIIGAKVLPTLQHR